MDLIEYKIRNGLTYEELGEMFDCCAATVWIWATKKRVPKFKKAKMIMVRTQGAITVKELGHDID